MHTHFPTAQQENPRFHDTSGHARGDRKAGLPEDGTIAVSDAKRKIYAKRLILISALLLIIFGIIAVYLGAANLYKYLWWLEQYDGDYTDSGYWTKEAVRSYVIWGTFFTVTGVLGVLSGLILFFRAIPAVAEDNRHYLRKILLPIAIIGWLPSPGLFICGLMLTFAWLMYKDDRFDLFGLLLEDVTQARRPMPGPAPVAVGGGRDAYATGYTEQAGLYSDDYSQAQYGGGEGSYKAGDGGSLLEEEYAEPAMPTEPEPAAPATTPMCPSCGKPTEWIEEYNRHYCYDCDAYV